MHPPAQRRRLADPEARPQFAARGRESQALEPPIGRVRPHEIGGVRPDNAELPQATDLRDSRSFQRLCFMERNVF